MTLDSRVAKATEALLKILPRSPYSMKPGEYIPFVLRCHPELESNDVRVAAWHLVTNCQAKFTASFELQLPESLRLVR